QIFYESHHKSGLPLTGVLLCYLQLLALFCVVPYMFLSYFTSTFFVTLKCLSLLNGLVSSMCTTSPTATCIPLVSALYFFVILISLLYTGCLSFLSTDTTTVLVILSDKTVPTNIFLAIYYFSFLCLHCCQGTCSIFFHLF